MNIQDERRLKQRQVTEYLDTHKLDAVLLSRRCNFSWFTCGAHNFVNNACDVGNSWLLVDKSAATVITSNIEFPRLRQEELADSGIEVIDFPYYDAAARNAVFEKLTAGRNVAADAAPPVVKLPPLALVAAGTAWPDVDRQAMLSNSFAFGGNNLALVLGRGREAP